jgi:hypothetical protein
MQAVFWATEAAIRMFCSSAYGSVTVAGLLQRALMGVHKQAGSLDTTKWNILRDHVMQLMVKVKLKPCLRRVMCVGLGTEFRSEKIPRNRLGMVSVIPRKKVLIPRHSEFRGRANSEARNETEFREKMKFYGTCTAAMITLTTSTF